jgi:hypothetical protein
MRPRAVLLTVASCLLVAALPSAAAAKHHKRCALYFEKHGCAVKGGEYDSKKPLAQVLILGSRGFNFGDTAAPAKCSDGSTTTIQYRTGNQDPGTSKKVRIGQTQAFNLSGTSIVKVNGFDEEIPVQFAGTVKFSTARRAKLKGTINAQFTEKTCSGGISAKLKRNIPKKS